MFGFDGLIKRPKFIGRRLRLGHNLADLGQREANRREVKIQGLQVAKLRPEDFHIPARALRQLVIRQRVGSFLGVAPSFGDYAWDCLNPEFLRR